MNTGYLGDTTPKLGFGLMRLPMIGDEIDMEQTKAMVDTFMAKGFTYFDTAYVYINGKSEVAAREAIVKRYPRDSFTLATKLPLWDNVETEADMQRIFDESMERAGVEYFDYYLLHAMDKAKFEKADRIGAWDFLFKMKAQGKIKHCGFLVPRQRGSARRSAHQAPGSRIRTAPAQLHRLGKRQRAVQKVLRGRRQAQ